MLAAGKQVPEHFAEADDLKFMDPCRLMDDRIALDVRSFCWISSSGTPLVSGTIVFTQISCSTIMPQKNRKT